MQALPIHLGALAFALLTPLASLADRPLVSETADVIEAGACQLEAAVARTHASGSPTGRLGGVVFTCGLSAQTQPALLYERAVDGQVVERLQVGAKTTLLAPAPGRAGFGVAYSAAGIQRSGSTLRVEEFAVSGLFTTEVARSVLAHANLGWGRSRPARQSRTLWSLGVETVGDFTVAADAFGDDRDRPAFSVGLGALLSRAFSFNAAYASRLERPRIGQVSIGAKLVF